MGEQCDSAGSGDTDVGRRLQIDPVEREDFGNLRNAELPGNTEGVPNAVHVVGHAALVVDHAGEQRHARRRALVNRQRVGVDRVVARRQIQRPERREVERIERLGDCFAARNGHSKQDEKGQGATKHEVGPEGLPCGNGT